MADHEDGDDDDVVVAKPERRRRHGSVSERVGPRDVGQSSLFDTVTQWCIVVLVSLVFPPYGYWKIFDLLFRRSRAVTPLAALPLLYMAIMTTFLYNWAIVYIYLHSSFIKNSLTDALDYFDSQMLGNTDFLRYVSWAKSIVFGLEWFLGIWRRLIPTDITIGSALRSSHTATVAVIYFAVRALDAFVEFVFKVVGVPEVTFLTS